MIADPNQIDPYNKTLGGPKLDDDLNHIKSIGILFRTIIRKEKIERIYGSKDSNRKEKF